MGRGGAFERGERQRGAAVADDKRRVAERQRASQLRVPPGGAQRRSDPAALDGAEEADQEFDRVVEQQAHRAAASVVAEAVADAGCHAVDAPGKRRIVEALRPTHDGRAVGVARRAVVEPVGDAHRWRPSLLGVVITHNDSVRTWKHPADRDGRMRIGFS